MQIQPLPYETTAALERFRKEGPFIWLWEPERTEAVLGAGTPETDVDLARCAADGVPVYRRRGGGGAVVLAPGCLVITAGVRGVPAAVCDPVDRARRRGGGPARCAVWGSPAQRCGGWATWRSTT